MFGKACHPTGVFKTLLKSPKRQIWEEIRTRVQSMLILIPTEEQTMHMRNAVTIPSSYQNVLCGIWSQNKLQRGSDTLVGCLCKRNVQVVSWSARGTPTCKTQNTLRKQILWRQSTLWKQILWQQRFPAHWEISELIYWGISELHVLGAIQRGRESICILSTGTLIFLKLQQICRQLYPEERQTDLLVQVEAIVLLTHSPACCNHFFPQTLWSGEADFIGLTCLILWITHQLRAAIPTSTRGAHAEKTKPRICSKKSFPAQQVLAIPKRKPKNSSQECEGTLVASWGFPEFLALFPVRIEALFLKEKKFRETHCISVI